MATTTIDLPPDVQRELEALARRTGRTEVEIIVDVIERHLQSQRPQRRPHPRSFGMIDDPEVTGENLEDWLAANWKPDWE